MEERVEGGREGGREVGCEMLTAAQTKLPLKMSEQLLHLDDSADKRAGISNSISNKQQPQKTLRPQSGHEQFTNHCQTAPGDF